MSPLDPFRQQLETALGPAYTIERELTGGGMSHVFVATERALNRTVVVKVLKPELAAGVNRERFRREIMLVAQLQHPHIVPVLNAGEHGDLLWYTMPFVEGESLRESLARGAKWTPREVSRVLHDVLDALAYAHRRGIIHRDIKPGNILRHGAHSLVTDFGVAKALSASLPHSGTTSVGIAIGTPAYMAPEQLAADPSADHRMDLYAVGLLAYELLTGEQPFAGKSPQATMAAQFTRMPTPLEECCPGVPPQLSSLVMRLLSKQPEDRPESAAVALEELESFTTPIGSTSTTATTVPMSARASSGAAASGETVPITAPEASRQETRRVWPAALGAVVGVAAVAVAILLTNRKASQPTLPSIPPVAVRDSRPIVTIPAATVKLSHEDSVRIAQRVRQATQPQTPRTSAGGVGIGRSAPASATSPIGPSRTASADRSRAATSATVRTAATEPPKRVSLTGKPLRVAVLPVRDATNRPEVAAVARALEDSLRAAYTAAGYTLASDAELVRLLATQDPNAQRRVADDAGIGALASSLLLMREGDVTAQVILTDVWRGMPIVERGASGLDDPRGVLGVVRDATRSLGKVSWRRRDDQRRIIVYDLENQTGLDSLDAGVQELSDSVRVSLARTLGAQAVSDSATRATRTTDERRRVGILQNAGVIVAGSVYRSRGDSVTARVSARDMSEERTFNNIEVRVPRGELMSVLPTLLQRLSDDVAKVNWGPKK